MKLPLKLNRQEASCRSADAFYLPSLDGAKLGHALAFFAASNAPQVFRVRGGYLLIPMQPDERPIAGFMRLRCIADHFYIPVDSELSPAILPDEFPGITGKQGLLLLPTECLAYDPASPVPLADWFRLPILNKSSWNAFPRLPYLPDSLRLIERPMPPGAVAEILRDGEPEGHHPLGSKNGIAEEARPPSAGTFKKVAAGAALGAASALMWIGKQFGWSGLAKAASKIAGKAVAAVPRMSERIIGEQEAALRELLRQLQSGDVEKAMKRAPIAVADPNSSGTIDSGSKLSERDPRYSFADLLRGGSGGAASAWIGGGDVWYLLQAEYRKQAEVAVQRGDYKRAAYIYGVLLRDLRSAVNVLNTGGRYRDAAFLLRDRLNDPLAAADCFDKAGDYDEAVRLYEKQGEDLKAAELLRRIGEVHRAEGFYLAAGAKLAQRGDYAPAGDLMRDKLGRVDLANAFYREGWKNKSLSAITCGERLVDDCVVRSDWGDFDTMLDEATTRYAPPATTEAARFFNYVRTSSEGRIPEERGTELSDRVRQFFAEHLREMPPGRAKSHVGLLFGKPENHWSPSVRRDAAYAAGQQPEPKEVPAPPRARPLPQGIVRALASAPEAGVVFIGTANEIVYHAIETDKAFTVTHNWSGELIALSANSRAKQLYALHKHDVFLRLTAYGLAHDSSRLLKAVASADLPYENEDGIYLQPRCHEDGTDDAIIVSADGIRRMFHTTHLLASSQSFESEEPANCHWIAQIRGISWYWADNRLTGCRQDQETKHRIILWEVFPGWLPMRVIGGHTAIDAHTPDDRTLILAGIDDEGILHRSEIVVEFTESSVKHPIVTAFAQNPDGFTAVVILATNSIAVATRKNEILIYRLISGQLRQIGSDRSWIDMPAPIVHLSRGANANHLVAVFDDGIVKSIFI